MKLSVAMCTYNGAPYILDQLNSFLTQQRQPDELLIHDDRSTDETVQIIEKWAQSASFPVDLHVNSRRLGSIRNFDACISNCRGDLIAFADQDDVWLPQKLSMAQQAFQQDADLEAVFSDAELVDSHLRPLGKTLWQSVYFDAARQQRLLEDRFSDDILANSFVTGATLTISRSLLDLLQPFPANLPAVHHDRWIAMLTLAVSKMRFISEPLMLYRQHSSQQVGAELRGDDWRATLEKRFRRDDAELEDHLTVMRALKNRLDEHPERNIHGWFADSLTERLRHVEARTKLASGLFARTSQIIPELRSGRYKRFGRGAWSALKDLMQGA